MAEGKVAVLDAVRARRKPPSGQQAEFELAELRDAIDRICDAWDDALRARAAVGFGSRAAGPSTVSTVVKVDAGDPLHTYPGNRRLPSGSGGAFGDPTGNAASQRDVATAWLRDAQRWLQWLLFASGADEPGERRWTGRFHPPALRSTLKTAARDLIEMWPLNAGHVVAAIYRLAGVAEAEWPPTPKPGTVIDGVKVLEKTVHVETCTECRGPIAGTAADPLARIDGKPYHRQPCYNTVYQRKRRSAVNSSSARQQSA